MTLLIGKSDIQEFKQFSTHTQSERYEPYIKEAQTFDLKPALGGVLYVQLLKTLHTENIAMTVVVTAGSFAINDIVTGKESGVAVATGKITSITGLTYTVQPLTGNFLNADAISATTNTATISTKTFGPYFKLFYGTEYTNSNDEEIIYEGIRPALVYWMHARFTSSNNSTSTPTGEYTKKNEFASQLDEAGMSRKVNGLMSGARNYFEDVITYIKEMNLETEVYPYDCGTKQVKGSRPRLSTIDRTKTRAY